MSGGVDTVSDGIAMSRIFITGGMGYLGSRLIPRLVARGHEVRALVRPASDPKLHGVCPTVHGDPLVKESFARHIPPADTFVYLVGVPHPSPRKAREFRSIDLVSIRAAVAASMEGGIRHFIYLSAAHPAPVMKDYIAVRAEGEATIRAAGLHATILRSWYVLGPGHRWPALLLPAYWILERIPRTLETATRLGLVTLEQMLSALIASVESPCAAIRVLEVPEIRAEGPPS